jgi:phage-related protein
VADFAFEPLHRPKARERRRAPGLDPWTERSAGDLSADADHARDPRLVEAAHAQEPGDPLSPGLRADLEKTFGRDFGHVRVHSGTGANRAAVDAGAVALTRGAHIYLAAPQAARHPGVLAHELAHVVQQKAAPPLRLAVSRAWAGGAAIPKAASAPAARAPAAGAAQAFDFWESARSVGGAVKSGIRATAGAISEVGEDVLSLSREALMAVVRRVAPDFLTMFEGDGIGSFIRKLIERGLRSMFDGLTAPLRGIIDVDALGARFRGAVEWIDTIKGQLAKGDCSGVLEAARKVGDFFRETLQPVVDRVKAIAKDVEGFFRGIWEAVGAPILDVLKKIGGEVWESLKGFVGDLAALIRRVRGALGSAWSKVKGWLGIKAEDGEAEGGGLWNWVREKASAVGNAISDTIRPVAGPLKRIGAVMLLIVPGGQLIGIMTLWPDLKKAWGALSQKWDDLGLVPRAREVLANTIIPRVRAGAEQVGKAMVDGADWYLGVLDDFHGALASAAESAVGILTPLRTLIHRAREKSHALILWAREKLQYASRNMHALFDRFIAFMDRVGEALKELIAAVVNPFGLTGFLAGRIWLALPECLKGPIIDFLLDVLDGFIAALPTNPLLGLLWPVMKAALTGFVRKVRNVKLAEKIAMADKIAKIISGQSFEFAIGYLKGIVLGIWEEITSPFRALAAIFDLPEKIKKFLSDLGVSFCEIVEKVRCFLVTLAQNIFGKLDDVLAALQEYLENPSKILDLITCAAQGVLSAAESLGETMAEEMIKLFRSGDEAIGEKLGKFTGGIIVQAVISYFTAGVGAGASIVAKLADLLGTVGKAVVQVLKYIGQHLSKLINFVKGFVARIGRAIVKGAKAIFGKMKGFFRKVFAWFKRLFRRFRRKRNKPGHKGDTAVWIAFKAKLRALKLRHATTGVTHGALSAEVARMRTGPALRVVRFARVARLPRFFRPFWVVKAKRRGLLRVILPSFKVDVLQDGHSRWPRGVKRVLKRIKRLKSSENNEAALALILGKIKAKWHFSELRAQHDSSEDDFDIYGSMSPRKKVAQTGPRGLHTGKRNDPIPIQWYKPVDAYLDPISIRVRPKPPGAAKISAAMLGNTPVESRLGEARRVGIVRRNLVKRGDTLKLTGTPVAARARPESRAMGTLLKSLGFSLRNRDIDHVRDLAFGGPDAPENLWPLRGSTNKIASTQGNWYGSYRLRYKKWKPGSGWEGQPEKAIRTLSNKHFCIIGFHEGVPRDGGKGRCP